MGVFLLTSKGAGAGPQCIARKMLMEIYKHDFLFIFLLPNFIISVSWIDAMDCCSVADLQ